MPNSAPNKQSISQLHLGRMAEKTQCRSVMEASQAKGFCFHTQTTLHQAYEVGAVNWWLLPKALFFNRMGTPRKKSEFDAAVAAKVEEDEQQNQQRWLGGFFDMCLMIQNILLQSHGVDAEKPKKASQPKKAANGIPSHWHRLIHDAAGVLHLVTLWDESQGEPSVFQMDESLRAGIELLYDAQKNKPSAVRILCATVPKAEEDFEVLLERALHVALMNHWSNPTWQGSAKNQASKSLDGWELRRIDFVNLQSRSASIQPKQTNSKQEQGAKQEQVPSRLNPHRVFALQQLTRANRLARSLSNLPPNVLHCQSYRQFIQEHAKQNGLSWREFDEKALQRMGAGAFLAVTGGSLHRQGALVNVSWIPPKRLRQPQPKRVSLVGKGICFDTGGHNLKPARSMLNMHRDMSGSAVALALVSLAAWCKWPWRVDAWLAIAENHLSPSAYKQNDVVRALNGTTIEIMHTDAEGRMVLADALTLACQQDNPDLILDFATLTGSMVAALGNRYSGVFTNSSTLHPLIETANKSSGERVMLFPMDADYETALMSKVADVKQCTLDGEADHILAACFLHKFIGNGDGANATPAPPWLHMDLSAAECAGGLGAVSSEVTGFGVAWSEAFLQSWHKDLQASSAFSEKR